MSSKKVDRVLMDIVATAVGSLALVTYYRTRDLSLMIPMFIIAMYWGVKMAAEEAGM